MDSELILQTEQLGAEGIVRYKLSDPQYIENGWTILPVEKVVRKVNIYRMQPVNPEFDWFERNKNKGVMKYDTGERLAEFDENGRGRWYYRNGRLALDYYDAKENNTQQRFIIYSNGEPDEKGRSHPITVLGLFDFLGNGVILDHSGKVRQNRLICDECQKSTKEVQKVAEIKSTDLLIYSHKPNTKTSKADTTGNAGDNDAHKMFVAESTNNTKMRAADIALAMDQHKVSCPRCRYIMYRAQKSLRQIPIVEGILPKNICEHCQAQINDRLLIKEQFIYSKLKSGGILIWRRKAKELLKDSKITKFKHKDLYLSIKRRERRPIITATDPRIRPLITSLKLDEESLSGVESPIKKVSFKETVEVISKSPLNTDLGKNFLPQSFHYKFPKLLKKSLSEEIIRDRIRSSTELFKDIQARLHMQAEEKKKKSYDVYESEDSRKSGRSKKSEEHIDRKKREKGSQDIEQTAERKAQLFEKDSIQGTEDKHEQGKPDKEKVLPTIKKGLQESGKQKEEKPDKAKDGKPEKEKEGKSDKEKELSAPRKGKDEKSDKKKSLPAPGKGLPTPEKEKEMKPGKEKALLAPGKKEAKSDIENVLSVSRKPREEKPVGKGLKTLEKEKEEKSDTEKTLPKSRKGAGKKEDKIEKEIATGKEKEEKSEKDDVLPVLRKPKEEKLGDAKDGKSYKEEALPASAKGLHPSEKEKEMKLVKEKALPEGKIDKEKAVGKEKDEKTEEQILPVARRPKDEKLDVTKYEKLLKEELLPDSEKAPLASAKKDKLESQIDNEMDKRKGKTRKKTPRGKGAEEDKETVKQTELVDNEMLEKKESKPKDLW
ncbi:myb-like protein X [Hyposmocoma kahamanoa]|uniref:myb-like protein X n=1 Tax=Hyposmocoma kahamanoa TaxID=1477025 RepID=UPI000E6D8A0B|nr:myb-like protein X [Hyposmocoma kahamanoa]